MNSKERREARYQRRKAKRLAHRLAVAEEHKDIEELFSFESLYDSYMLCKRNTNWKASVQRYGLRLVDKLVHLVDACCNLSYYSPGFYCFDVNERGKLRHIKSVCIEERVVQKSLTRKCLIPVLSRTLIYDNGATLKHRGIHHQLERLYVHLQRHYRTYGNFGFIYLFDFTNYFGSIPTNALVNDIRDYIIFDNVMHYVEKFIFAFGEVGIGLGSEISQISAVFYPNPIDHYIKDQMRIKGFGRFMDDGYIICHSKKYLKQVIQGLKLRCKKLGIKLNEKKSRMQKLSKQFTFLKPRIRLADTGKIIKRVVKSTITRERRRLKKYHKLYKNGLMTYEQIEMAYKSWKGSIKKRGLVYRSIQRLDRLFNQLFIEPFFRGYDYFPYRQDCLYGYFY